MSITQPIQALNLDFKQQQLFVNYFNTLPEKPSCTVKFFNHGDFYSLHDNDAKLASDYTGNIIKYMGDEPKLSYVTLKRVQFEKFLRELLLVRQYRVEVYIKTYSNKINDWKLEYKGSPGNLTQFEEILFENVNINFSSYVMAMKILRNKMIAVACINVTELQFKLCEINDNECFTELETLIAQIGPKECIIPQGDSADIASLKTVLKRNSVLIARMKKNDFIVDEDSMLQDLNRLLFFDENQQRNASTYPETNLKEALGCLQAIIRFLNLTGDEQNFNQYKISTMDIHRFVRLDNAALYSLNILPKIGLAITANESSVLLPNTTKNFSLLGILDHCITPQGKRLLEQWVKQPLRDYNLINERLDIVETLVKNSEMRHTLNSEVLTRLPDLLLLSKKLSSKKSNLQDCYKVYQIVSSVPLLLRILRECNNKCVYSMLIDPLNDIVEHLERYQSLIEEILDFNLVDRGEYFIKHTYSSELSDIYQNKKKIEERMHHIFKKAADDLGFDTDKTLKLECNDQHGYYLRVTLKEEQTLRKQKHYQILDVVKAGVRFTNNKLSELNDDYNEVKKIYEEKQKVIIEEVVEVASSYGDVLRNLNVLIATVDVLLSFAKAAIIPHIPYIRPKLLPEGNGIIKMEKVRHPCIELQENVSFISNNVEFNQKKKIFHIITGPNMCGKSTFIRSIGVCTLMAHIGSLVPCSSAEISLVDGILARVGAEDCEIKGLSTFMMEMIETSTICKTATSNSLVIIDELGRGTSTYDGCGIAWAIADYLAREVKSFSLFATHFHEITQLADQLDCVNNLHVTAATTEDTITPLYIIKQGHCDNSYGIHCARMADFPKDVIESAVEHQKLLEHSNGLQFIKEFEQEIKKTIIEEGDLTVKDIIEKLKSLKSKNLTKDELQTEIKLLKNQLEKSDNLFINGLLKVN